MELVPIRCQDNNSKKFDDKVWWEDLKTIVEVNGEAVDETLQRSVLNDGDRVLVKFGGKTKKLFKGVVEFPDTATSVPVYKASENSPSKTKRTSPSKTKLTSLLEVPSKSPVAKSINLHVIHPKPSDQECSTGKNRVSLQTVYIKTVTVALTIIATLKQ